MLDLDSRVAVWTLHRAGHSIRAIAKAVGVSRNGVRTILRSGQVQVPEMARDPQLAPHLDSIRELYGHCGGNLVRVYEELLRKEVQVAYSSLTRFCRQHQIGVKPKHRVGRYHFEPGEEMQHDTSPHVVVVGGKSQRVHCAALVLCYCRMLFAQAYPKWDRFHCKVFLTEALRYFGGAARRAMVDNSNVVIAYGSGAEAVVAAEMEAFSTRFGFVFVAHEIGDANRSARVERPFHYIEHNFYPGRTFTDLQQLNSEMIQWCNNVNQRYKRNIQAKPRELFAVESQQLVRLPLYIPEVYSVHQRKVDSEGYVNLHTNRYSVPDELIGRDVELHETIKLVRVFAGHKLVVEHQRLDHGMRGWSTASIIAAPVPSPQGVAGARCTNPSC